MLKRVIDLVASSIGLIILSPMFIVLAILIKRSSKGPVFYRGQRLCKNSRPFKMLKFRSMFADAEQKGTLATSENDDRITSIGKFIRKYKLDEFPQLINVLKGDMSLVGPRPEATIFFEYYTSEEKNMVLSVKPGMTDYASIYFHDESSLLSNTDDIIKTYIEKVKEKKIELQRRYIQEQSIWTDLKIIFLTIKTIINTRFFKE